MLHLMEVKLQRSNFNPSCNLTHSVYSWNRVLIQRRGNQSYTLRKLGHFLTPFAVPNGKLSANHAFVSLPYTNVARFHDFASVNLGELENY